MARTSCLNDDDDDDDEDDDDDDVPFVKHA